MPPTNAFGRMVSRYAATSLASLPLLAVSRTTGIGFLAIMVTLEDLGVLMARPLVALRVLVARTPPEAMITVVGLALSDTLLMRQGPEDRQAFSACVFCIPQGVVKIRALHLSPT